MDKTFVYYTWVAKADAMDWLSLLPEVFLVMGAIGILFLDRITKDKNLAWPLSVSAIVQVISIGHIVCTGDCLSTGGSASLYEGFMGMICQSPLAHAMRVCLLIFGVLAAFVGKIYLQKQPVAKVEFFSLLLFTTAAFMVLVQARNFILLFVALEAATIGLYSLIAYGRTSPFSLEAGLKYLILSGISAAFLLFGIILLYGMASNSTLPGFTQDAFGFTSLSNFICLNAHNAVVRLGILMIISGLAFKMGLFPFQIWVPDVYQGAPTPTMFFLLTASKSAVFFVMLNLIQNCFQAAAPLIIPLLYGVSAVTIIVGNAGGLVQQNLKRLLGLSGIANSGYLTIALIVAFRYPDVGYKIMLYLLIYSVSIFITVGVMAHIATAEDHCQLLGHYRELVKKSPFLACVLLVGVGSLAGIPPLAGFIGKLMIFALALKANLYPLLAVAVGGVVASMYYYFSWIREVFFPTWKSAELLAEQESLVTPSIRPVGKLTGGVLAAVAVLILLLGLFPGIFSIFML